MSLRVEDVRFDERGLVPAVVQDARTREVLTLAYMNAESLARTLAEGETWFWSRSRGELWHKGATSGHTQRVVSVRLDCDADALVVLVDPRGPACHTGARSCFKDEGEGVTGEGIGLILERLYAVIEGRRREMPAGSYTTYLFEKGLNKILKKVGEESAETIIAAKDGDDDALTSETADLVYHLLVMLVERGVGLEAVGAELARRAGGKGQG
ncbi:MAG TPA: bifunctional phosphoribosyl-AMP cyclohydrolase/phosphoribosyl-ATP diphosphatase HisIE [Pyrinomonadaceae bacterium]|jgi:phosphoribosyl-ATP pyrophosphohydrolase/phosphoribosyl-AMP cyclohydrolase|nr:bifunctional phosphoribosyl-AMP cyclohydrolase/phosphoribosyl-ATP diphosphatase HisIE [Pyrinomonadaceae bacterium]